MAVTLLYRLSSQSDGWVPTFDMTGTTTWIPIIAAR